MTPRGGYREIEMRPKSFFAPAFFAAATLCGCGGGSSGSSPAAPPVAVPAVAPGVVAPVAPPATTVPAASPSASPVPSPAPSAGSDASPSPPAVPPTYAPLYNIANSDLTQFEANVNAACPIGASHATPQIVTELEQADSNYVVNTLPGQSAAYVTAAAGAAVAYAVNLRATFGITSVMLGVNYPLLVENPANFPNASYSVANTPTFLSYYEQLVAGLRANGIGVDIETNLLFPSYAQGLSYAGLTIPMLVAGKAEQAQRVLDTLRPDYLNLESEPLTLSENTGIAALNDPATFASLVASERAAIDPASSPATKIGAGSADWSSTAFLTQLIAQTNLDYYDLHLYPPFALAAAIPQLQTLHATGKPVTITETWLNKTDPSIDGNPGPAFSMTMAIRNAYSFWGPLDAAYIGSLAQLGSCEGVAFMSLWNAPQLYSYVDYNPTTAAYSYTQMQAAVTAAGKAAMAAGTVSAAGAEVRTLTGTTPATILRRSR